MKIFIITHSFALDIPDGGGGEIFVSDYLKELSKRGHEIFVFTTKGPDYPEQQKKYGIKVHRCNGHFHHAFYKYEYIFQKKKALELAKKFKPDVIHSHNSANPGIIGEYISKKMNLPHLFLIEFISNQNYSMHMKFNYQFEKYFTPKIKCNRIVCWSKHVIDKFLIPWKIPEEKIFRSSAAVDLTKFNPNVSGKELTKKFGEKIITIAKPLTGTNTAGIEVIINAFAIFQKEFPDYKLILFGNGIPNNVDKLKKLIKKHGLEKNILLEPALHHDKMPIVYAASKMCIHSFMFEATTSMGLMETMAMGKPIIITNSGEVKNIVENSVLMVPIKNPKEMAKAMKKIASDEKYAKELGKKARKVAEKRFSLNAQTDFMEKMYKEIIQYKNQEKLDENKAKGKWVDYNVKKIFNAMKLTGPKILDVGCNDGKYLKLSAKKFGKKNVKGLDIYETHFEGIETTKASVTKMPFSNKEFDSVFMKDVLHHVPIKERKNAIQELIRVAKKEVVIVEANKNNWYMGKPQILKEHPHYTKEELELFIKENFDKQKFEIKYLDAYPFGTNQVKALKIFNYFPFLLPIGNFFINKRKGKEASYMILKIKI